MSAQFSSFRQSCLTLQTHGLQHARLPCPSPTPGACSNSCPLSRWCHPTISSSVVPFFSRLQSFPASGSFQMSQFFTLEPAAATVAKSLQSCLTLCNTTDCSSAGSSVRGISQARILEWVAISFFRGIFPTQDQTRILYRLNHQGSPYF